jgi:hypothetical protein
MQVRYQAAPRPDRPKTYLPAAAWLRALNDTLPASAAQDAQYLLEFEPQLPHDLLALADVAAGLFAL